MFKQRTDSQLSSWPDRTFRVLQVVESLARGGAERRLVNDLTYLRKLGVDSRIIHVLPADNLRGEIESLGYRVEWLGVSGPRGLPRGIVRLKRLIRSYQPDIIHSQLFFANICARFAGMLAKDVPVMTSIQNTMYEPDWKGFYDQRKRLVLDRFTSKRYCHHAVAVSHHAKESAVRFLGFNKERVTVIHNTVDTALFKTPIPEARKTARTLLGVSPNEFAIVSAARFVPQKGFHIAVMAMPSLLRQVPGARLFLAGGGEEEPRLRSLCRELKLDSCVQFLGVRNDIHQLFQGADAFVFTSLASEGFPLVPLEAMALNVPVVASRIEPMREMINHGESGLLFSPGDPDDLALAITELAADESRKSQIAEAGRRRAENDFDAERGASRLAVCYRMVADQNRGRI